MPELNTKICIRCQREISSLDNFIQVVEWHGETRHKDNFMHKNCWDEVMDGKKNMSYAMSVLKKVARKAGIEDDKEDYVLT